jgi:vitamin B12 transporter
MSRLQKLAFASAAFCALSTGARAEGDELSGVVVTSRSLEETLPQTLSRYGSQLDTISAQEVKNGGYVDITQALEMLAPGVFVQTQAGPFSYVNISIQGSRTSDVLWTLDGVRINNRLYNTTSPADTLPASMVERIEVLKGGQGLFYGTSASAGVINVVTRAFSDKAGGEVSLGADGRNGFHGSAYVRGKIGGNKLVAWYSKDETDGYYIYTDYQPNTTTRKRSYDVNSWGLKYGYDLAQDLSIQGSYIHTTANLDYPSVTGNSVNDRKEQVASARLDYTPNDTVQFFLKGYYHQWDTSYYTKPNPSRYWGYKDMGANALVQIDLHKGLQYNIGYDGQRYRGRDEVLIIEGKTQMAHAVFGQIRTTDDLSTRARGAAGVRVNHTSGGTTAVWNVSGVFDLTKNLYLEGIGGTSFLLPDSEQLYSIDPDGTHGNPDLKPERSRSLTMALGGKFDIGFNQPLTVTLSGWKRQVTNLITTDNSNPPVGFEGVFVNINGKVKVSGAELDARAPLGNAFSVNGSYTYSKELARGTTVQIAGRPRYTGKLGLSYAPANLPFGADFALKYVGKIYSNAITGFGVQEYGGYTVANASAHAFLEKSRVTQITVRLENVFNERYATNVASAVRAGSVPSTRFFYQRLGPPRIAYITVSRRF